MVTKIVMFAFQILIFIGIVLSFFKNKPNGKLFTSVCRFTYVLGIALAGLSVIMNFPLIFTLIYGDFPQQA